MFTNLHQKCSGQAHVWVSSEMRQLSTVLGMWHPNFLDKKQGIGGETHTHTHTAVTRRDMENCPCSGTSHVFAIKKQPAWQERRPQKGLLPAVLTSLPKQVLLNPVTSTAHRAPPVYKPPGNKGEREHWASVVRPKSDRPATWLSH